MKRLCTLFFFNLILCTIGNAQCTGSELIISQVAEGSSSNKSVEIFNPTGAAINLADYVLRRAANGNGAAGATNINLIGSIPAGGVFVISNGSSNADILAVSDDTNSTISHNGNDSYILENNGVVVDSYGDADSSASFGANQNMQRDIASGTCPYDTDPEDAFNPADYFSDPYTTGVVPGLGNAALPVEFTSFLATSKKRVVVLDWKTVTEINNEKFDIQRSFDGKSYETIGSVKGEGNSFRAVDYTYTDEKANPGVNYYRLKQVDFDGNFDFSEVVSATVKSEKVFVAPSRTQDRFSVFINNEEQANINVYSMSGQLLMTRENVSGTQELNIGSLVQGTYIVSIAANNETQVEKIIKL